MPPDEQQDRDRDIRYIATLSSVSIGAIVVLVAERESEAWLGLLCAAGVWAFAMLMTGEAE